MRFKLLCHNTYWYQGHPFSSSQPGAPNSEVLARLCALYRATGADLLCLQEIQDASVASSVATAMEMDYAYKAGNLYPQYGAMIAANPALSLAAAGENKASSMERALLSAKVSTPAGTLGVACIHLTSGRQSRPGEATKTRLAEITEFLTRFGPETDILAGDFNEDPEGDVGCLLRENGFLDAAVLRGKAAIPASVKSAHRRDLIWIKSRWQDRLVDYGVIQDELAVADLPDKTFLSDHRPIWITLDC